jgi:hypothetical protein
MRIDILYLDLIFIRMNIKKEKVSQKCCHSKESNARTNSDDQCKDIKLGTCSLNINKDTNTLKLMEMELLIRQRDIN